MLKEMTLLVIVLWGSQGMPTPTPQQQYLRDLSVLYCAAEDLLRDYKSIDNKSLPSEVRPALVSAFSQAGCNFTDSAEECRILLPFHALFRWLQKNYPEEGLLTPVMHLLTKVIALQESHSCLKGASYNLSQITCPKYNSFQPELENKFHFVFELFRNQTHNLWRSKLPEELRNVTDVCSSND